MYVSVAPCDARHALRKGRESVVRARDFQVFANHGVLMIWGGRLRMLVL